MYYAGNKSANNNNNSSINNNNPQNNNNNNETGGNFTKGIGERVGLVIEGVRGVRGGGGSVATPSQKFAGGGEGGVVEGTFLPDGNMAVTRDGIGGAGGGRGAGGVGGGGAIDVKSRGAFGVGCTTVGVDDSYATRDHEYETGNGAAKHAMIQVFTVGFFLFSIM